MPITLNHSNIGVQYSSDKSYIIETVKSDLYRDNIIANNIQAAPVIPSIYIENNNVYAVESYAYTGSANTADYVREFPKDTLCDILVVGGGGSGSEAHGGGGGAGAVIFMKNVTMNGNYTIKVGTGGVCEVTGGVNGKGKKGIDSEIFKTNNVNNKIIAEGGGGGGQLANANGGSGGSGGGGDAHSVAAGLGGAATPYTPILDGVTGIKYGNNGGNAFGAPGHGGGGGGAGGVGENALATYNTNTEQERAHGGVGIKSATINSVNYDFKTLFGTNTGSGVLESDGFLYFGGGGGNGRWSGSSYGSEGGNGGLGGGGKGGWATSTVSVQPLGGKGYPGINGTGGGGGGGGDNTPAGGNGGSGIVIIRYLVLNISSNLLTTEPTITTATTFTETIRSFTHSGGTEEQTTHTITIGQNTICDILIVGGGGSGGEQYAGGGGGGGGLIYYSTILNGTYSIKVGDGGKVQNIDDSTIGDDVLQDGKDSSISQNGTNIFVAKGGGKGLRDINRKSTGGSGGGGGYGTTTPTDTLDSNNIINGLSVPIVGQNYNNSSYPSGQGCFGNIGGKSGSLNSPWFSGGGGGAGSVGGDGTNMTGTGTGGSGKDMSSIFGTTFGINGVFAGGGGGYNSLGGSGGGGGGQGSANFSAGINGTGGGGGGSGSGTSGKNGGSGIVIIKFRTIVGAGILDGTTHKRLNFAYTPNYPFIQADNTNLKAWYKFDGNYMDSSPSGFNLTNSGAAIVDGLIVQSLSTDASDFLETSGINLNGKTYSISFWLKFNTTPSGIIFIFSQSSVYSPGLTVVFQTVSNSFRFSHYGSGNDMDTIGYDIATIIGTSWHHYVITYNNTNIGAEIWVDGVKWNTNISTLTNRFTGGGNFMIAKWQSNPTLSVNGLFEDFRYYDKILTSTEISQLYNIPTTNQYTLNFPVPTLADINNNSNIVLRGAYDIVLSTTNAIITPKTGQYIPKPTTFASDLLSIRYNILNPLNDPTGAQWAYSSNNTNMCHIGSVGIGTTNPEYTLDVSGSVNAKSYYLNGRQINEPLSELGLSEGMIAQVRHLTYTQMEVKNNLNWDAINDNLTTGFVIAITPKSNLSKILLNIIVHIGLVVSGSSMWWGIKLYRKIGAGDWTEVTGPNGTETGSAAATAGTPVWISYTMYGGDTDYQYKVTNVTGTYLDSPNTTSTVYYTAHWNQRIGDNPDYPTNTVIYLNRAESHGDAYRPAPSSSWTASEIWYG